MKINNRKNSGFGAIIEIQEETRIPQGDSELILEKGDKVQVFEQKLEESVMVVGEQTISDIVRIIGIAKNNLSEVSKIVSGMYPNEIFGYLVRLNFQSYYGKYNTYISPEDLEAELQSFTMKTPTTRFVQAIHSVRAYLYQLEGKASRDKMALALERIIQTSTSYASAFSDGKGLYWGE